MLVETKNGLAGYESLHGGSWAWEYFPPPFDFLAPANSAPMPAPRLTAAGFGGFGCPGPACGCNKGVGDLSTLMANVTAGNFSDALMGSDLWPGIPNVIVLGVGGWLLNHLLSDFGKAKKTIRKVSSSAAKRRRLKRELEEA